MRLTKKERWIMRDPNDELIYSSESCNKIDCIHKFLCNSERFKTWSDATLHGFKPVIVTLTYEVKNK